MIYNQRSFAAARAYGDRLTDTIDRFMPMVHKLAWHLHGTAGAHVELDDLVQVGLVALTECIQTHQGPNMDGFAAYAKIRVKGAMIDEMRRSAPLSRGAIRRRRELQEAENRLRGQLGREPTLAELAAAMKMAPKECDAMRTSSEPLHFQSMDDAYSDSDMAFCDQSPDSFAVLVTKENREALINAIGGLPERLQLVMQLYFVEELNLTEIAAVLGVSVPRVHQLKDQALKRIREDLVLTMDEPL